MQNIYLQAFEFYNKGLALLSGNISPPIKDSLLIELAGAHLSMATLMQDNAPLQSMAEEKVISFVMKMFCLYVNGLYISDIQKFFSGE